MVRITFQLLAAALTVVGAVASNVIDLTPSNFDEVVLKSGKPALVEFFAPWCGHCKNLAPVWEELADSFSSSKDKVVIAKVDADQHKSLGKDFGISGFPTLKYFDGKSKTPVDYNSGRDLESLQAYISERTGIKVKGKKAPVSAVQMLTDSTFNSTVNGDKDAFIAFTAPWCGHCKTLAPTWEKLAATFASETGVLVAKVDCDSPGSKQTAEQLGVKSYPTIKFFPKGSTEPEAYSGGRSEEDLVNYLNGKAGTYRTPGGGLSALAGVIPSLDSVVGSLKTGGETAYSELEKAAGALQDKYAEYYVKVGKKAQANADYVSKEYTRLQGLIKKGGLAPEKLDDLVSRSNILSKFKGDVQETIASIKEEL